MKNGRARGAGKPDSSIAAFDAAFPDLILKAFRLAHRMLGDRAAAEDVAAEALSITLVRWKRVEHLAYREAWVLRVTANLALKAARRRNRDGAVLMAASSTPTAGTDFTTDVALRLALAAALQSLPKRQRESVVLRYLSGLPEPEVARLLGVSQGTVKTHTHRGLESLRVQLGTRFEEVDVALAE